MMLAAIPSPGDGAVSAGPVELRAYGLMIALGNWFNQELYGRPTDLPWGLEIDPAHRPAGLAGTATYHPAFLYEATWNLALAAVLVAVDRRWHPPPGVLFTGYVAGYPSGRLWVESLRIDPATEVLGLRVNLWVSGLVLVAAAVVLVARGAGRPDPAGHRDHAAAG